MVARLRRRPVEPGPSVAGVDVAVWLSRAERERIAELVERVTDWDRDALAARSTLWERWRCDVTPTSPWGPDRLERVLGQAAAYVARSTEQDGRAAARARGERVPPLDDAGADLDDLADLYG